LAEIPGKPDLGKSPFALVCYGDPNDSRNLEYGCRCTENAVNEMNDQEFDG